MKVLCYGSLNLDYVYSVPHFVHEGETLSSLAREIFPGGKGLNQSIALARAGLQVSHAGAIGSDEGDILIKILEEAGVDTSRISRLAGASGHAIIQRDPTGKNGILLFGGANQAISRTKIDQDLQDFTRDDYLILQNEINELPYIVDLAYARGLKIVFNPSPLNERVFAIDLSKINIFLANELEAQALLKHYGHNLDLSGVDDRAKTQNVLETLHKIFPSAIFVLTLGEAGSAAISTHDIAFSPAFPTHVQDTTGAGDCFSGYFLAAQAEGKSLENSLKLAAAAAAIAVSRLGTAPSIPERDEVNDFVAKFY